jgi:hypothetical protein
MAGETQLTQIGKAISPFQLPGLTALTIGNLGVPFMTEHVIPAGAGGAPDDVIPIPEAPDPGCFPVVAKLACVFVKIVTNVAGSTIILRNSTGGGGDALSDSISSATTGDKAGLGTWADIWTRGKLVVRRSDSGVAARLTCLWIVAAAGAGTTPIPGASKPSQMLTTSLLGAARLAVESSVNGTGNVLAHASHVAAGAGPFALATTSVKCRLAFWMILVTTAGAGGSTVNLLAPDMGARLVTGILVDVTGMSCGDPTGSTADLGTVINLTKTDAATVLDVLLLFVPVA